MPQETSVHRHGRFQLSRLAVKTFATRPRQEPSRLVPCALCGGRELKALWNCEGFSFVRCPRCGLVQQNPQPEPEAVQLRYDESYLEYEEKHQESYRDLELRALEDLGFEETVAAFFDRTRRGGTRPRLLDVGCATGALLSSLRERGWDCVGVEISPAQVEYGRKRYGLDIIQGTLESARFAERSFDLVHASHLIEHLNDPRSFLREVRRILKPEGFLILTTPNADGLQARLLGSRWRSAIYDHLYLFSLRTLEAMLDSCGYTMTRCITWGGWARGLRPACIKPLLDRFAKLCGLGDVMAILAHARTIEAGDQTKVSI